MKQNRVRDKRFCVRRSFTLLELLIAMTLVGISTAYGGLAIFRKLKSIQWEKQNKAIEQKLQLADKLARLSNAVIEVKFAQEDNRWVLEIEAKKGLSSRLLGERFRKIYLDNIESLTVENASGFDQEKYRIEFFPTGPLYKNAKIVITPQNRNKVAEIELTECLPFASTLRKNNEGELLPEEVQLHFQEKFHSSRSPSGNNPNKPDSR